MSQAVAIIIGGGPAGLTAAYELLTRTGVHPIVLEMSDHLGGIARTVNYKGNRIDIGGHRFFSKADRVMDWWLKMMPLEGLPESKVDLTYQQQSRPWGTGQGPDVATTDRVMLLHRRKSRIYFLRQFFDYPIQFNGDTIKKLGLMRMGKMGLSYLGSRLWQYRHPRIWSSFSSTVSAGSFT